MSMRNARQRDSQYRDTPQSTFYSIPDTTEMPEWARPRNRELTDAEIEQRTKLVKALIGPVEISRLFTFCSVEMHIECEIELHHIDINTRVVVRKEFCNCQCHVKPLDIEYAG